MTVSKSRCSAVQDMKVEKPSASFMTPVIEWLSSGVVAAPVLEPAPVVNAPADYKTITLDDLVIKFGVEKVMETNGGQIPGTQDELNILAEVLAMGTAA